MDKVNGYVCEVDRAVLNRDTVTKPEILSIFSALVDIHNLAMVGETDEIVAITEQILGLDEQDH